MLSVVTNPGDDIRYQGGAVWPDFDIVLYGLAGVFDEQQGWGIVGDTYSSRGWFGIGDRDLEISRRRAAWLDDRIDRDEVARRLCSEFAVATQVVPASAGPYRTLVRTAAEVIEFQEWLVRLRASEAPIEVTFEPATAEASPAALSALEADLVLLGPSSPVASLAPIVTLPEIRDVLQRANRIVAVSPTVLARSPRTPPEQSRYRVREALLTMVGVSHTPAAIGRLWAPLVDGYVVDASDSAEAEDVPVPTIAVDLLGDQRTAAEAILGFARSLPARELPRRVPAIHSEDGAGDKARRVG